MENRFTDYYMVLGVPYNSSLEQIKKAYRHLAKVYHPDVGGSESQFKLIQEAYQVLYDNNSREHYNKVYLNYLKKSHEETLQQWKDATSNPEKKATKSDNHDYRKSSGFKWRLLYRVTGISLIILFIVLTNIIENDGIQSENLDVETSFIEDYTSEQEQETNSIEPDEVAPVGEFTIADEEDNNQIIEEIDQKISIDTEENMVSSEEKIQDTIINNEHYFTLGSSKEKVKEVMGPPSSVYSNSWSYNYSNVTFDGEFVIGWSNISDNLNVKLGEKEEGVTFTLGSSKDDVLKAMGTPTSIYHNSWGYQYSDVTFDADKVVGWSDISDNLNVFISEPISSVSFTIGSSKEEVLEAMGTPSGVSNNSWSYDYSTVRFDSNGFVESYSNISDNLRVY
ncbi:DnaJ domain-containing protein [Bacillus timonensis]|uniref:DnaJ domain-containing protein n=1 Tax=Bacillus timonensis TaxID=1033734 RepID=UPI00028881C1|nr:DnaJ domain-containing protein [Bacillus timonensis]